MGTQKDHPFVYINFTDSKNRTHPMQFKNPIKVIIAKRIEEVLACFKEIQQATYPGYYAAGYLSYESAPAFAPNLQVNSGHQMPLLWFGIFNEPVRKTMNSDKPYHTEKWKPAVEKDTYNKNI